jgi:hypothetical protein
MKGTIRTTQRCHCGSALIYLPHKGGCFCPVHPEVRATDGWYVQLGRHQKRFSTDFYGAERHLNFIRAQRDHGQYDPRDWQKSRPYSLDKLGQAWMQHKANVRPVLSEGRMWELKTSINRACEFFGFEANIKTIDAEDIAAFTAYPHKRIDGVGQLSEKSIFNVMVNVKEFIEWACRVARIDAPEWPALGYEYSETKTITVQQQAAIVDWICENCPEPRIGFAIRVLARNPNVRPGEFVEVLWGHFDLFGDRGVVYIHKRKSRRKLGRRKIEPKRAYIEPDQAAMPLRTMVCLMSILWSTQ